MRGKNDGRSSVHRTVSTCFTPSLATPTQSASQPCLAFRRPARTLRARSYSCQTMTTTAGSPRACYRLHLGPCCIITFPFHCCVPPSNSPHHPPPPPPSECFQMGGFWPTVNKACEEHIGAKRNSCITRSIKLT